MKNTPVLNLLCRFNTGSHSTSQDMTSYSQRVMSIILQMLVDMKYYQIRNTFRHISAESKMRSSLFVFICAEFHFQEQMQVQAIVMSLGPLHHCSKTFLFKDIVSLLIK